MNPVFFQPACGGAPIRFVPACSPAPAHISLPQPLSYEATLRVPAGAQVEFHVKGYSEAWKFCPKTSAMENVDAKIERIRGVAEDVFTVKSALPFRVREGQNVFEITNTGKHDLSSGKETPQQTPLEARLPVNPEALKKLSSDVDRVCVAVERDGNKVLVERIKQQFREFESFVKDGLSTSRTQQFIASSEALLTLLNRGALRLWECDVPANGWNTRDKMYCFRLQADSGKAAPAPTFKIAGEEGERLTTFLKPDHPDVQGRLWAIAKDKSVLVARKEIGNGEFEYHVYLSKDLNGTLRVDPGTFRDTAFAIAVSTKTDESAKIILADEVDTIRPLGASEDASSRERVRIPSDLFGSIPDAIERGRAYVQKSLDGITQATPPMNVGAKARGPAERTPEPVAPAQAPLSQKIEPPKTPPSADTAPPATTPVPSQVTLTPSTPTPLVLPPSNVSKPAEVSPAAQQEVEAPEILKLNNLAPKFSEEVVSQMTRLLQPGENYCSAAQRRKLSSGGFETAEVYIDGNKFNHVCCTKLVDNHDLTVSSSGTIKGKSFYFNMRLNPKGEIESYSLRVGINKTSDELYLNAEGELAALSGVREDERAKTSRKSLGLLLERLKRVVELRKP